MISVNVADELGEYALRILQMSSANLACHLGRIDRHDETEKTLCRSLRVAWTDCQSICPHSKLTDALQVRRFDMLWMFVGAEEKAAVGSVLSAAQAQQPEPSAAAAIAAAAKKYGVKV